MYLNNLCVKCCDNIKLFVIIAFIPMKCGVIFCSRLCVNDAPKSNE